MIRWKNKAGLLAVVLALSVVGYSQTEPKAPTAPRGFLKKVADAAKQYQADNNAQAAIPKFEALVAERKEDFDANAWLGYLRLMDNRSQASLTPLHQANSVRPQDLGVLANLGVAHSRLEQWAEAAEIYGALTEALPEDATIWAMYGQSSYKAKDMATAVRALETSNKLKPGQEAVMGTLASAYIARGMDAEAEAMYLQMDRGGMTDAAALAWVGYRQLRAEKYAEAAATLAKAHSLDPTDASVMNNLAYCYSMTDPPNIAEAITVTKHLRAAQPNLFDAAYNLSSLYLMQGEYRLARDEAMAAIRISPGEPFAENNLGRALEGLNDLAGAAQHYGKASDARPQSKDFARNAAIAALRASDVPAAKKYIARAVNLGENDPDLKAGLAEIYIREGKIDEALALTANSEATTRNALAYWFNQGVAKDKAGNRGEAIEAYKKCLEIAPNDLDAQKNLALDYAATGRDEEAMAIFRKLATGTSSIEAMYNYAASLARSGDMDGAIEQYKRILHTDGSQHTARLMLANALWARGEFDSSRYHFATVAKAQPNNANALNGMGMWQLRQGDNKGAEATFRKAIASDSKFVTAYNNRALALERLNRVAEAIQVLQKGLAIDPNHQAAAANLKRLKASQG
ncbi:MAG: tetratricopeptide repeat protein [Fimbriimonadaceae bacterium]|nr:tetratricopeptide repeat protein [Fimbriimonadaceae bacterium]